MKLKHITIIRYWTIFHVTTLKTCVVHYHTETATIFQSLLAVIKIIFTSLNTKESTVMSGHSP